MSRVLLVLVLTAALSTAARSQSLEYEIKAAFLYNFARFVTWPPDAFASSEAPLSICILGEDPFGPRLDELVAGERVEKRPLIVRRLERPAEAATCHMLFVSPSERARFGTILAAVDTHRVLTVSDTMEFLGAGGHVSFFLESNRVRFAVNAAATGGSEFQVSAKLMQVARIYEPPAPAAR
jgi:hypothetical protein